MTIHERALQTEQQDEQPQYSTESTPAKGLTKLWLMGAAAWGHRWTSSLGELPVAADGALTIAGHLWARQLAGIPQGVVLNALATLSDTLAFPPTLSELKNACKDQLAEINRKTPAYNDVRHRMYHGKISARSAFNESVEENCKAFSARCKDYGYDVTDHNY